jgi:hypothetical protein
VKAWPLSSELDFGSWTEGTRTPRPGPNRSSEAFGHILDTDPFQRTLRGPKGTKRPNEKTRPAPDRTKGTERFRKPRRVLQILDPRFEPRRPIPYLAKAGRGLIRRDGRMAPRAIRPIRAAPPGSRRPRLQIVRQAAAGSGGFPRLRGWRSRTARPGFPGLSTPRLDTTWTQERPPGWPKRASAGFLVLRMSSRASTGSRSALTPESPRRGCGRGDGG